MGVKGLIRTDYTCIEVKYICIKDDYYHTIQNSSKNLPKVLLLLFPRTCVEMVRGIIN
jgi:hypothetical protein